MRSRFITSWELIGSNITITMEKDNVSIDTVIGESVGYGGTKRAYKITDDIVLVLPTNGITVGTLHGSWNAVVREEVDASEFLTSISLLNPRHERVIVVFLDHNTTIKTYISKSFEGFAKLGMYVSDHKGNREIPPVFYDSNIDLNNMIIWEEIFSDLIHDIIKMYKYNLPYGGDSMNLISVRTDAVNFVSPFKIRYFGFDFSGGISGTKRTWRKNDRTMWAKLALYHGVIREASEIVLFEEMNRRNGVKIISLHDEMYQLINMIVDHIGKILPNVSLTYGTD